MFLTIHMPAKRGDTGATIGRMDIARAFDRYRIELCDIKPAADRPGWHRIGAIFGAARPEAEAVERFPGVALGVCDELGFVSLAWEVDKTDPEGRVEGDPADE